MSADQLFKDFSLLRFNTPKLLKLRKFRQLSFYRYLWRYFLKHVCIQISTNIMFWVKKLVTFRFGLGIIWTSHRISNQKMANPQFYDLLKGLVVLNLFWNQGQPKDIRKEGSFLWKKIWSIILKIWVCICICDTYFTLRMHRKKKIMKRNLG